MSTLNETDILFVERNGQLYQITSDQMSTLNDTDLLLVERSGTLYKLEAQDLDLGPSGSIDSPVEVLTPLNGAGVGPGAPYNPISSEIIAIGGGGTAEFKTSEITGIDLETVTSDFAVGGTTTTSAALAGPIVLPPAGELRKVALSIAGTNTNPQLGFSQNFSGTGYSTDFAGQYFNSSTGVFAVEGSGLGNGPSGSTGGVLKFLDDGSNVTFSNGRTITFVYDSQGNVWGYVDGRAVTTDSGLNAQDPTAGSNGRPMITGLSNSYYAGVQYQGSTGNSQAEVVAGDDLGFNKILSLTDDTNLEQFTVGATVQGVSSLTSYVGWNGHPASTGYYGGWGNSANWDGLSVNDAAGGGSSSGPGRNSTPKTLVGGFNDISVGDWGTSSGGTEGWVIDMGRVVYAQFAGADGLKTTDASDQIYGAGTAGTALPGGGYGGTGRFFWLVYNGQPSASGLDVTLEQGVTIIDKDASATPPTLTVTGGSWDISDQSQTWSNDLTTTGSLSTAALTAFNGDVTTWCRSTGPITFSPSTPVVFADKVEVYTGFQGTSTVNGSAGPSLPNSSGWTTLLSGGGTLNSFVLTNGNTDAFLSAVRVDGHILVDPVNNSQDWSDGAVTSSPDSGSDKTMAFDGALDTNFRTMGQNTSITLNFNSLAFADKVEVYCTTGGTDVTVNDDSSSVLQVANGAWTTVITGYGTLDELYLINANQKTAIAGVRVDGKILMDQSIDRGLGDRQASVIIPYELTLTCTDDTELQYMVGPVEMTDENGDLITPQTSSITSVAEEPQNSQVWSDNISPAAGGSGWNGGYDITKAFTGNSCSIVCAGTSNDSTTVTLTINPAIPVTDSIRWNHFSPALSGITYNNSYTLDGVTTQVSGNSSNVLAEGVSGMLSELTWQATGSGDKVTYLNYILIDGKRLVDKGLTPPSGHEPDTILTFADNTDLEYFQAGDEVQSDWNQSQTWSDDLVSDNGNYFGTQTPTQAFDGDLATKCTSSTSFGTLTLDLSSNNLTGTLEVVTNTGMSVAVTHSGGTTTIAAATSPDQQETIDFGSLTSISEIVVTGVSAPSNAILYGVKLNGELLVDPTVVNPDAITVVSTDLANNQMAVTGGGSWAVTGVPTYASDITGALGITAGTRVNAFDGSLSTSCSAAGPSSRNASTVEWSFNTATNGLSGSVRVYIPSGTGTVQDASANTLASYTSGPGWVSLSGNITSYGGKIIISADGGETAVVSAYEVDGVVLLGQLAGDTSASLPTLEASATDVINQDGNSIHVAGVSGDWITGLRIKGAQVSAAAPSPSAITFTSSNAGTTAFSGTDATLASRTWTLQTGSSATGPWTTVGAYEDFDASASQDGATPWATNKPTLSPNTYYQVKVRYNSTNANSVESSYNTFQTGDA